MEKYGYKWDENGEWYSKWMTEYKAKELVKEYRSKLGSKPRTRFQFTFFGRMQNIGYTLDDFDNLRYTNEEHNSRKVILQDKYYKRLVEL
jgi:hypothetical protein